MEHKERSKKLTAMIAAAIVLILVGGAGAYFYYDACNEVYSMMRETKFEAAYEHAESIPFYDRVHPEMMGYLKAAATASSSDYPTAKELLQPYCDADYENANSFLQKILLFKLEQAVEMGEGTEELSAVLSDFQAMLEADKENTYLRYLKDFLVGYWKTADERYYFEMQLAGAYTNHNFPDSGADGYYFINGVNYQVGETPENAANELKFTLVSWDEVSVYCYGDQQTYTIYRT